MFVVRAEPIPISGPRGLFFSSSNCFFHSKKSSTSSTTVILFIEELVEMPPWLGAYILEGGFKCDLAVV